MTSKNASSKPGATAAKKNAPDFDDTLQMILPSPNKLTTTIGDIAVGEFKFKHLAKINPIIVEVIQYLDFEDLMQSLPRILYILFREDSESMNLLVEMAVQNKTIEELGELNTKETIALYTLVFRVAVLRYVHELKEELGKLKPQKSAPPSNTPGPTQLPA